MANDPSFWLFKTEPETYPFDQLVSEKRTNWNHVRNFQARNFLKQVKKGDLALIYHSGDHKAVVGIAECVKEAYPDLDPEGGDWVQIDLKAIRPLPHPVPLSALKADASLKDLLLIRQSRLSCMPVSATHYKRILSLAEKPQETARKKNSKKKPAQ